jgi:hypothetical protein
MVSRRAKAAIAITVFQIAAAALPAQADDLATAFAGKRIQMVIGWDVGGGYDIYARLLARHLSKHIPGTPTIVPQNMPLAGEALQELATEVAQVSPERLERAKELIGRLGRSRRVLLGRLDMRLKAGLGMGRPASLAEASHASMATSTSAMASSRELPKAEHDFKSGTSATQAASLVRTNRNPRCDNNRSRSRKLTVPRADRTASSTFLSFAIAV